ncbi:protein BTN1 [Nematostella vectensis]|uniref:protein BTN1 n=1 Tax=Nematostella vectensis TaxID=45351 RepID=UPI002076FFE0|nr:protein BTN1 [Nematostella vectensis]
MESLLTWYNSWRNVLCFLIFGIQSVFYLRVLSVAAQDILMGSTLPTSSVILSMSTLELVGKLTVPWIIYRIPFKVSFVIGLVISTGSVVVVVMMESVLLRVGGTMLIGGALAWNMSLFLAMAARYRDISELTQVTSALETGINSGSMLAAVSYTGLTTSECIAPRVAIAGTLVFSAVYIFFFLNLHAENTNEKQDSEARYQKLEDPGKPNDKTCCGKKSKIFLKVLPICLYLFVGFFAFFFTHFSVLTTLAFPSAPFAPSSHFKMYTVAFGVSRFLGGSELLVVSRLCPKFLPFARVHRIWVLSLIDFAHAIFFIFAAWYRFIPNVWIVLSLCVVHGFISGSIMVNGALEAADLFEDSVDKGIAMSMIQWGITAGIIAASIVGLFAEPVFKSHCQQEMLLAEYCITRENYTIGWSHPKC